MSAFSVEFFENCFLVIWNQKTNPPTNYNVWCKTVWIDYGFDESIGIESNDNGVQYTGVLPVVAVFYVIYTSEHSWWYLSELNASTPYNASCALWILRMIVHPEDDAHSVSIRAFSLGVVGQLFVEPNFISGM